MLAIGVATTTPLPAPFEKGNPNAAGAGAFFMFCPRGDCDRGERHYYNWVPQIDGADLSGELEVFNPEGGRLRGAFTIQQILDDSSAGGVMSVTADFTWIPHDSG